MKLCFSLSVFGRIHCCDSPISDADGQKEKGDDRVEEGGHDVADCPENPPKKNIKFMKKSKTHCLIIRSRIHTHLLPSFSNAIAMRSLDLRNISIITMTASVTESKITAK